MTEDEITDVIMSAASPLEADLALAEVAFWLAQDGISDEARFRVMYQAEHLVMMLPQGPLDPPD